MSNLVRVVWGMILSAYVTAGACAQQAAAPGQPYAVTDLGFLHAQTDYMIPHRINERGEVIGRAILREQRRSERVFLWLPTPNYGLAAGLQDAAPYIYQQRGSTVNISPQGMWVATRYTDEAGHDEGVAWLSRNQAETRLLLPGGVHSMAADINASHWAVGSSETNAVDAEGRKLATPFIYRPSTGMSVLPLLNGYPMARADGISDRGEVVGMALLGGERFNHGVCDYDGAVYWNPTQTRGVIWRAGNALDLNSLLASPGQWIVDSAKDVNNRGVIVGTAIDAAGRHHAVVLSPVGADFNANGVLDAADLVAFTNAWFAGDPRADYVADGCLTTLDLTEFQTLYLAGTGIGGVPHTLTALELRETRTLFGMYGIRAFHQDPQLEALNEQSVSCGDLTNEQTWRQHPECWNQYNEHFNPKCRGCDGGTAHNAGNDGKAGWDPDDGKNNPYFPNGGPGGSGIGKGNGGKGGNGTNPGGGAFPGGGGNGGNGGAEGGNGGNGGDSSGPGAPGGDGGGGGPNGNGGNGGGGGGPDMGGHPGLGGSGGNGGSGGKGGDGGGGGPNGSGGNGGNGGSGGAGGNGGGSGSNGSGGNGGNGGSGGAGGNGGGSGSNGSGGNGGLGGGGDSTRPPGKGGTGGNGDGVGNGGDGGNGGGSGSPSSSPGAPGGNGGAGGSNGGRGGNGGGGGGGSPGTNNPGGKGGDGGAAGGNGGAGGAGGNGGNGQGTGNGGAPGTAQPGGTGNGGGNGTGGAGGRGGNGGGAGGTGTPQPGGNGGAGGAGGTSGGGGGNGGAGGAGGSGSGSGPSGGNGGGGGSPTPGQSGSGGGGGGGGTGGTPNGTGGNGGNGGNGAGGGLGGGGGGPGTGGAPGGNPGHSGQPGSP